MADPSVRFRSELASLRDATVAAISDSRLADVEEAIDLYLMLVLTALDHYARLGQIAAPPQRTFRPAYGREFEWLETDARTLVSAAVARGDLEVMQEVRRLPFRLLIDGAQRKDVGLIRTGLRLYEAFWSSGRSELAANGWEGLERSLLLELKNFVELYIARDDVPSDDRERLVLTTLASLANLARVAAQTGDEAAFGRIVNAVTRMRLEPFGRREWSRSEPADPAPKGILGLGLEAFVMMLYDRSLLSPEAARRMLDALRALDGEVDWATFWAARENGSDVFGWLGWEMSLTDTDGGVITFSKFLELAFVDVLAHDDAWIHDDPTERSAYDYERLIDRLHELNDAKWHNLLGDVSIGAAQSALKALMSGARVAEEVATAALPLDSERIDTFKMTLIAELDSRDDFASRLPSVQASPDDKPQLLLGLNSLVPKHYFAATQVHAMPNDLGREYARALIRGELTSALGELTAAAPHSPVDLEHFPDAVRAAIRQLRQSGKAPAVFLFNEWRLLDALRDPELDYTRRYDDTAFENADVLLDYTSGAPLCLVCAPQEAMVVTWVRQQKQHDDDTLYNSDRLVIGVETVTEVRAEQLRAAPLTREDDTASQDTTDTESELRRLQQSAIVRMLEQVRFDVTDATAAMVINVLDLGT
jgi:hypothetical protein